MESFVAVGLAVAGPIAASRASDGLAARRWQIAEERVIYQMLRSSEIVIVVGMDSYLPFLVVAGTVDCTLEVMKEYVGRMLEV